MTPAGDEQDPSREIATNATATPDPFAFDEGFLADVRVTTGAAGPSSHSSHDDPEMLPSRRVSARYTISQCRLRWGRGGYPEDVGPDHELVQMDSSRLAFVLNP